MRQQGKCRCAAEAFTALTVIILINVGYIQKDSSYTKITLPENWFVYFVLHSRIIRHAAEKPPAFLF